MAFYFIKRFDLLAHINEDYLDSRGGFRASLFQNKENKEFILAIAGSDLRPLKFDIGDLISDFILLNGKIPKKQFDSVGGKIKCRKRKIKCRIFATNYLSFNLKLKL